MKQIAKTQQVIDRMRAAFGPDVDVARLPVYEAVALNTLPLRKSGGLFKGARATQKTLSDVATAFNSESQPMQIMHGDGDLPVGRAFYGEVQGDEVRALFTCTDPVMQTGIENGTIDQVSVGFMPSSLNCSVCGFNYLGADATLDNLFGLVCNDGHVLGENGAHAVIDGVGSFYELSLVNKGAAQGARIVGPTESRLQGNNAFKLAASSRSDGVGGVYLTATQREKPVDLTEVLAKLTAATTAQAELQVKLVAAEGSVATLTAANEAFGAQVTELNTKVTDLTAKADQVDAALAALKAEAITILTACSKDVALAEGKDVTALLALINEHRAEFAAAVPVGGKAKGSQHQEHAPAGPSSTAAFSQRR